MTVMAQVEMTGTVAQLRPLRLEDADRVVRWRNQPEIAAQMFAPPPTLEQHVRWFEALSQNDARQEFVICKRSPEAAPVGTIGLSAIDPRHSRAEYGILIGEPGASGRGIATDASRLLLDHAFGTLDLHRVYLHVFHDNARAIRLYERLGFVREGVLREHARRGGAFVDVVAMGILREEWLRSQR